MKCEPGKIVRADRHKRGQRGMALILAIAMLLILSVFGTVVLDVANRGISQSGKANPENEAFFTADRTVEYGLNTSILDSFETPTDPPVDLTLAPHAARILMGSRGELNQGSVEYLGSTNLPSAFLNSPKGITSLVAKRGGSAFHVHAEVDLSAGGQTITRKVDSVYVRMNYGTEEANFGDDALKALGAAAAGG